MVVLLLRVVCQVKSHVFLPHRECVYPLAGMSCVSQPLTVLPLSTLYKTVDPGREGKEGGRSGAGVIL